MHLLINNIHTAYLLKMFFSAQWIKMRKSKWWRISESFMNGKHSNRASTFRVRWKSLAKDCTAAVQDTVFGEDLFSLPGRPQHMAHTQYPWQARSNRQNPGQLRCQRILLPQVSYRCPTKWTETWTLDDHDNALPYSIKHYEREVRSWGKSTRGLKLNSKTLLEPGRRRARTTGMLCGSPGLC